MTPTQKPEKKGEQWRRGYQQGQKESLLSLKEEMEKLPNIEVIIDSGKRETTVELKAKSTYRLLSLITQLTKE